MAAEEDSLETSGIGDGELVSTSVADDCMDDLDVDGV